MYPFEVFDETTQRIEFYFDKFEEYKEELFRLYPPTFNHARALIRLKSPSDRLEDVPVHDWNPHHSIGNHHLSVYDCFYDRNDWSTIFEVYPVHDHSDPASICMFVEREHTNPWGEPVRLMSTASGILNQSSHRYAQFRGKYWKITSLLPYEPDDSQSIGFHRAMLLINEANRIYRNTLSSTPLVYLTDIQYWFGPETDKRLEDFDWMVEGF